MTREEAIHIIDTSDLFWTRPTDDEKEALCLAIEALEQPRAKEHIDPERLIQMIRYSSQYNTPCPEWVYDVIRHS